MQDFHALYSPWSDAQLLAAYRQVEDYVPAARQVMEDILRQRGLLLDELDRQSQLHVELQLAAQRRAEAAILEYERKTFGAVIADSDYAAQMRQADGTLQTFTAVLSRKKAWVFGPLVLGIMGLLTAIAPIDFESLSTVIRVSGGLVFVVFSLISLFTYVTQRSEVRLKMDANGQMLLQWGNERSLTVLKGPLQHSFFAGMFYIEQGPAHPILLCFIEDSLGNGVLLEERLTALQSPPPHWPHISQLQTRRAGVQHLLVLSGDRPILQRLKKILDGLGQRP